MKGTLKYLAAALVVLGAGMAVAAQPAAKRGARGPEGPRFERAREAMVDFLGLTEAQQESWKSLREEARKTFEPLMQEQRRLHQELRAALESGSPDATAVGNLMISLHKQRQEMQSLHKSFEERRLAVLTPEQQTKLEAFQEARKMGPGQHKRGSRPFGPGDPADMGPGFGPEPPPEPEGN